MLRTVLVPLDGSWFAESTLATAGRIVTHSGAKLHLVLVHQPVPALAEVEESGPSGPEGELEWRARERFYLATTAAHCSAMHRVTVGYREMDGSAGPAICEEAGRIGADLVIMATHGRGGLRRFWLGGVADYVVRHSAIPVLLVHPDQVAPPAEARLPRSILVALDQSKETEAILDPVVALARATGAWVTLAHVCEASVAAQELGVPGQPLREAPALAFARVTARERLERIAARLRGLGLKAAIRILPGGGVAGALLDLLEGGEFDLIALTTHGRGGMQRLLMGSVADKVIRGAGKPVLVLRPPPTIS
jgi:nucleotide-binding universal stress UspA family protein